MPKVNYFEIQADEPEQAMTFYEKAFGWKFNKSSLGQGYWSFKLKWTATPFCLPAVARTSVA